MNDTKALILDIQRLSTEDGPGLRTTVFFKGCNLRCAWCHNPESISFKKQIEWHRERCLGCALCTAACKRNGLHLDESGMCQDRSKCIACESCVKVCPGGAMEVKGVEWALEDLTYEVLKDRSFFGEDGGVTLSGGEALMQPKFAGAFLRNLHDQGIHTAVDTAGAVPWEVFERIIPYTDLFLLDIKLMDPKAHRRLTGISVDSIHANAKRLAAIIRGSGRPGLWIRTPIIPGATDSIENIRAIGRFLHENLLNAIHKWELCSFNNLCRDKYQRLGIPWAFEKAELIPWAQMEALHAAALASISEESVLVQWSGTTRME